MIRKLLLAVLVLMMAIAIIGCESAGAGGDDTDTSQEDTGDDGATDDGTGEGGSAQVPAHIPAGAAGAVDGSAYEWLEFSYNDGDATSGYNTEVSFSPDASGGSNLYMGLSFHDDSDSSDIDAGTYTLDFSSGGPGTVDWLGINGTFDPSTDTWDYLASDMTEAEAADLGLNSHAYDQIVSGTVIVSQSDGIYTFQWSFDTSEAAILAGSYTGPVNS